MPITTEQLLDKIAEELILDETGIVTPDVVLSNQKKIFNGTLQLGSVDGKLALYQKDEEANEKDLLFQPQGDNSLNNLSSIAESISNVNNIEISIQKVEGVYIIFLTSAIDSVDEEISFIVNQENNNPLNVSQFIPMQLSSSIIDVEQANEFLDTNIFELLPTGDTRQARIVRFFQELNALLPPNLPEFDLDEDGRVDRDNDDNWIGNEQYSQDNSISYAQDNPIESNIDEEDAYFHRLKLGSVLPNDTNSGKTIEDIYNRITPYLTDLLEEPPTAQDERPEYENQSNGYLQFRNLNQGIIIRNTNQDFIEGLDPNNPTYLDTGFTITMWVRFLDKSSEGTLFNFGNPTRQSDDAFGFRLETYVLNKDDDNPHSVHETWGDGAAAIYNYEPSRMYFENSNTARFVRLVVNDNGLLRDSHIGVPGAEKFANIPDNDGVGDEEFRLLQTTFIPEDFQEWYFICASFNTDVNEDNSYGQGYNNEPNFWLNHMNLDGTFTVNSGYGNKCKVEIISRTDLLRARGFKV